MEKWREKAEGDGNRLYSIARHHELALAMGREEMDGQNEAARQKVEAKLLLPSQKNSYAATRRA